MKKPLNGRAVATIAAFAGMVVSTGFTVPANPQAEQETAGLAASATAMPPAVEDFSYPDADKILQEKGIRLIRGDGHIMSSDCGTSTNEIQVWQRKGKKPFCFAVLGQGGFLALDMPRVYAVVGNDFNTEVDMTVGDATTSYDIEKNLWTPVGETADPDGRDHALIEIRSTK
ncbi:hypothetical protein [Streptomyces sp. NPDC094032]|uniref:hypothetical protein n=1 Tax=Streptomyces sp. NPDC094032 TaxID=3155308 RepID=UPI0033314D8A